MKREDSKKLSIEDIVKLYSYCIDELVERNVLRTKNVTGELGEFYAQLFYKKKKNIDLVLKPVSTEGVDAVCNDTRYAIKGITGKTTSVFYGVTEDKDNKVFDKLIIVILSDKFLPIQIVETDWEVFYELKRKHSTMDAYNISVTKELLNRSIVYDVGEDIDNFSIED